MNTLSNCCRIVSQTLQLNSSVKLSPVERWKVEVYRYVVPMMLLLCFVSFSANVFILITTRWLKKSLTPNLVFTLSLTATDAWVSLAMGVGLALNSYLPIVKQLDVLGRSSFCFNLAYEALRYNLLKDKKGMMNEVLFN